MSRSSEKPVAGISLVPYTDSLPRIRELVQVADDRGLELVGIQDHPYQARFLDTFSLIATLLAETQGGGVLNTAFIERLNATFRSRLAPLVRRTRRLGRCPARLAAGIASPSRSRRRTRPSRTPSARAAVPGGCIGETRRARGRRWRFRRA